MDTFRAVEDGMNSLEHTMDSLNGVLQNASNATEQAYKLVEDPWRKKHRNR